MGKAHAPSSCWVIAAVASSSAPLLKYVPSIRSSPRGSKRKPLHRREAVEGCLGALPVPMSGKRILMARWAIHYRKRRTTEEKGVLRRLSSALHGQGVAGRVSRRIYGRGAFGGNPNVFVTLKSARVTFCYSVVMRYHPTT